MADPTVSTSFSFDIPCVKLPAPPKVPTLSLFGMLEFKGVADIGAGLPNKCSMNISLLLQLMPYISGLTCFLRVLKVIKTLGDFAGAVPNPVKMGEKAVDLVSTIAELSTCFGLVLPTAIIKTIKEILLLVVNLLSCLLSQLQSLISLQLSIDLNAAAGNPALQNSLQCALDNAQTQMDSITNSLDSLGPLLEILNTLGSLAGISITLPSIDAKASLAGPKQAIDALQNVVSTLQTVADSLPG